MSVWWHVTCTLLHCYINYTYNNGRTEDWRFLAVCAKKQYVEDLLVSSVSPCGSGLEYLHHSPVSHKQQQKGCPVPGGYNWSTLFHVQRVSNEKVKCGSDFCRTWTRDLPLVRPRSNCTSTYRPIRDGIPQQNTTKCPTVIKIWSWDPDGCPTPRQINRLTTRHNITSTTLMTAVHLIQYKKRPPPSKTQGDSVWSESSWESSSCKGVSTKLLWLRPGDSSGTKTKGNVCHWTPLPDNWWRHSWLRRLSACSSELQCVCEIATVLDLIVMEL
jgi:hypothetical protein